MLVLVVKTQAYYTVEEVEPPEGALERSDSDLVARELSERLHAGEYYL
jgi:hypothetical protein